jgi:ubiquitin carboxyl-terminal hydrolase 25/28
LVLVQLTLNSLSQQAAPGGVLPYVANFLSQDSGIVFDSVTPEFLDQLKAEVTFVADELALLRIQATELKTKLEAVWAGSTEVEYELTSVFIHRGTSPTFGHYFFYARDLPRHPDRWFKYNDAEVTQVPRDEVFANTSDQTANPYLVRAFSLFCCASS